MKPTDTELTLLRPLWQSRRLSAREIHDATEASTGWSFSSTRKTLDRMVDKGLIAIEMVHGVKTFIPTTPKLSVLASLIGDFSKNILGSDQPLPAAAFVGSSLISEDEIDELEDLLKDLNEKDAQS
ncbi:BlaI/MecI/CopY family transcriptional regulator [Ponticaulis sp.]|uniref:BlaI/MecI/CopY family transcriptional regulator n=1 Tax=Ponticaulis sp. TaxID=2020902 RepID=UPI000B6767DC|nr:BlaI/MecI/CopY family transcriptional regulator [Ponticaulis sp.]MAJ09783.1 penicillinase repressor [Ponticaulis sp.]MBN04201.1 penicillinase repressor [Ponticaulis sp.]RPG17120.1 MAG: BlaI/MecI/CopY family transcriptional regulator [Hyphomonadaceae bacterium TMED125]HBJ94691.1 penicillinase repressor [Hyphomonadaceae bacterium]|tara:strand:+ start:19069 stop:19446 length:378 start_codon:yes stop_codon:yes gene_type:complete